MCWEPELIVPDVEGRPAIGFQAVVRSDSRRVLGIVSDRYQTAPNRVLRQCVEEFSQMGFTKGSLGETMNGARTYAYLEAPLTSEVPWVLNDIVRHGVIISNRHDGAGSWSYKMYSERLVCLNGMTQRGEGHHLSFRHTASLTSQLIGIAPRILEMLQAGVSQVEAKMVCMVNTNPSREQIEHVLNTLWPDPAGEARRNAAQHHREHVRSLMESPNNSLPGMERTGWALYNSITEHVDHRSTTRSAEARLESAVYGHDANIKAKAEELVLALR